MCHVRIVYVLCQQKPLGAKERRAKRRQCFYYMLCARRTVWPNSQHEVPNTERHLTLIYTTEHIVTPKSALVLVCVT